MPNGRQSNFGPSAASGNLESTVFLLLFSAFVLKLIALTAPEWIYATDQDGQFISMGLWHVCINGSCSMTWKTDSNQDNAIGRLRRKVPPELLVAEIFYVFSTMICFFMCFLWQRGQIVLFLSLCLPCVLDLVAYVSARLWFDGARGRMPSEWEPSVGYASDCALAELVLIWVATMLMLIGYLRSRRAFKLSLRSDTGIDELSVEHMGTRIEMA